MNRYPGAARWRLAACLLGLGTACTVSAAIIQGSENAGLFGNLNQNVQGGSRNYLADCRSDACGPGAVVIAFPSIETLYPRLYEGSIVDPGGGPNTDYGVGAIFVETPVPEPPGFRVAAAFLLTMLLWRSQNRRPRL